MTEESRFNGEYKKTGTGKVSDEDLERVKKADEQLNKHLSKED
jgi:hypothetical protein